MKYVLVSYGRPGPAPAAPGEWIATYPAAAARASTRSPLRPSQLDLVDCETVERAIEIALLLLSPGRHAVEVRALMHDSGAEM